MPLTSDEKNEIRRKFIRFTTRDNPLSKRKAWTRIAEEMDISYTTARYWSDEVYKQQKLKSRAKYSNTSEGKSYTRQWNEAYFSDPEAQERRREYARLRRSKLVKEVLPQVYEKADQRALRISDLVGLIEAETGIRFRDSTLTKLLIDQYSISARGPPIEEVPSEPNSYQLRKEFYNQSSSDDSL